MKHLENRNALDLEALELELDLEEVPAAVDAKLRQVYAELPDRLPVKKQTGRVVWRSVACGASAVAAAFLMLFGTNAVNPALAESLPLVGNLFSMMNGRTMTPLGGNLDTYGDTMQKVGVTAVPAKETGYGLSVEAAFCDGKYVYASFLLSVPQSEENSGLFALKCDGELGCRFLIDGKEAKEVNYAADKRQGGSAVSVALEAPKGVKDGDSLIVSLDVQKLFRVDEDYNSNGKYEEIDAAFTAEFPVTVDLSKNTDTDLQAMDNGIKLYSVERTPGYLKAEMEIPVLGTQNELQGSYGGGPVGYVRLFTEDGREIRHNSNLNRYEESEEMLKGVWGFDGPAEQAEKVVLRVDEFAPGAGFFGLGREDPYVFAEFTIDLKNGTAESSDNYLKEGLKKIDAQEYKSMKKYPDYAGGYLVQNLVIQDTDLYTGEDTHGTFEVGLLAGTTEYRPLEIRFYQDGKLAATVKSHPESEYNDRFYQGYDDGPYCYRDETGTYTATDTDYPEYCDGRQMLYFAWNCPPELARASSNEETQLTLQLADSETGEVLLDGLKMGDICK